MISLLNKLLERQTGTPANAVVQNIRNQQTEPQTETDKDMTEVDASPYTDLPECETDMEHDDPVPLSSPDRLGMQPATQ